MRGERRKYFWLVANDPETGKPYLIYGGTTEAEARQQGIEMLSGVDFEIKALPTMNLQAASSMLKGRKLKKTHSLRKASERLGHTKSVRRMRRRRTTGQGYKDQGYEFGD